MPAIDLGSSFSAASPPYLFATEFPFAAFDRPLVENKRVLTIAGSGDVAMHFASQGARHVSAVDVSGQACALCALKLAAVAALPHSDFLRFFLAGLEPAAPFLRGLGLDPVFRQETWRIELEKLYRANPQLSGAAWLDRLEKEGHPFAGRLRATELRFLDRIPYLGRPEVFRRVQEGADRIGMRQEEIAACLNRGSGSWDLIYLSNVPEYQRLDALLSEGPEPWQSRLARLLGAAAKSLSPSGTLAWYVFHDPAAPEECLAFCRTFLAGLGFEARSIAIAYGSDRLSASRFLNGLIVANKRR